MEEDPFDAVQNLEGQYYNEGYALGLTDGAKAGHLEGRFFGLEKGFEKFLEMGTLYGRSIVWSSRLSPSPQDSLDSNTSRTQPTTSSDLGRQCGDSVSATEASESDVAAVPEETVPLPQLSHSLRLERHLKTFYALCEPESLDKNNNEDAVSDFDDRLKRAKAKARIIEKLIGEESTSARSASSRANVDGASIEDTDILSARH